MVAIAVDRYLCICRPFTRLLTVQDDGVRNKDATSIVRLQYCMRLSEDCLRLFEQSLKCPKTASDYIRTVLVYLCLS